MKTTDILFRFYCYVCINYFSNNILRSHNNLYRIADAEPPVPILKLRLELLFGLYRRRQRLRSPVRGRDAALLYGRTGSTFVNFNRIYDGRYI